MAHGDAADELLAAHLVSRFADSASIAVWLSLQSDLDTDVGRAVVAEIAQRGNAPAVGDELLRLSSASNMGPLERERARELALNLFETTSANERLVHCGSLWLREGSIAHALRAYAAASVSPPVDELMSAADAERRKRPLLAVRLYREAGAWEASIDVLEDLVRSGDHFEAVAREFDAIGLPLPRDTVTARAESFLRRGEFARATAAYEIIGLRVPRQLAFDLAHAFFRAGDLALALGACDLVNEAPNPRDLVACGDALLRRAVQHAGHNATRWTMEACRAYDLAGDETSGDRWERCGSMLLLRGQLQEGEDAYRRAGRTPPPEEFIGCGRYLLAGCDATGALAALLLADEQAAADLIACGRELERQNDIESAAEAFSSAGATADVLRLARSAADHGRLREARALFRRAVDGVVREPSGQSIHQNLPDGI